jgi:hypothetical protein
MVWRTRQAISSTCMAEQARKRPTFREIEDDLSDLRRELNV